MSITSLDPIVQHLYAVSTRPGDRGDEDLLRAFVASRDEAAFAAIVKRYGRLVLGVCRRALRHEQDAEDAFQATFLVLARHAGSIRKGQSLPSWLHGVAYRISGKARHQAARRQAVLASSLRVEPGAREEDLTWNEVQTIVDEEIERLPELYRTPLVLCCLQDVSRAEAAERLGVKDGTLSSRLAQGRKRLQAALARRGVACGAIAGLQPATQIVPLQLITQTVRLVADESSVSGVNPTVHLLAQGATSTMNWYKGVFAMAVLLTVAALAGGAGLLARPSLEQVKSVATAKEDDATVEIQGRVVDPDGKPAVGASLSVWRPATPDREATRVATADKDGRFSFRVSTRDQAADAKLVAQAKGFASAWADLKAAKEPTLQLVKDDVVLEGRALNLEGAPLADVTVNVSWICQHPDNKIEDWISGFLDAWKKGSWIHETGLRIVRPQALGVARSVKTDKTGRFRLEGVGRDRIATVILRSETTVAVRLQIVNRAGPKEGWNKGNLGLYATGFTFLLAPCKPIYGTVRDKKTGKPIAGVKVAHNNHYAESTTNDKGEYRLIGAPKEQEHMIALGGGKGVPYIDYTRHNIRDTAGLEPMRVDFDLDRGVEITGRVVDKETGQPVRGSVSYFYAGDNPNLKDHPSIAEGGKFIISDWGKIAADGSFTVLGIPGRGALVVRAQNSTNYVRVDSSAELSKLKSRSFPSDATHGFVAIDVDEADAKSRDHVISVTPAASRAGKLVDGDGAAVSGAKVVGLSDSKQPRTLATNEVTMPGLRKERARALVAIHEEKQLGAVAAIEGTSTAAFEVKLQPLGTLTGRLVDADGNGMPDLKVKLHLKLDAKKVENLPTEWDYIDALVPGAWREFTSREATTDKDGRFRITGLIPGERYDLMAGEGSLTQREQLTHRYAEHRVEPGKTKDVGDLKPKKTR